MKSKFFLIAVIFLIPVIPLVQASLIENIWYNTLSFFGIIEITNANHLNSDRVVISDVYDEVKELDGIWSETIPDGDYVRVTFEEKLTNKNDITIFPRIISGSPKIEIYERDGPEKIAEFTSLNENQYNKVFLKNLVGEQDKFDLKIVGGSVEFEHIIDPTQELFEDCSTGAITNQWTVNSWSFGTGGDGGWCVTSKNVQSVNMTATTSIDLSAATSATLNFTHNNNQMEGGDFLRIYANSSAEGFQLIYSDSSSNAVNVQINLEDYITLTTGVHIRAECTNNHNAEYCKWDNINLSTITLADEEYPQFSNYWDNNGTLEGSGTGLFNVTITSTNGTVLLEINNQNTTATNLTSYVYNVSYNFASAGVYAYRWHSWGNGTSNNYNFSIEQNYTVNAPSDTCTCPSINTNWEINMADSCVISSTCNLGTGNISFIGTGNATFNAAISFKNLEYPTTGQTLFIGSNALITIG